jgi:hypothetical protein
MGICIVGAVAGFGGAMLALLALLCWPGTASIAFLIAAVALISVSAALWAVHEGWVR